MLTSEERVNVEIHSLHVGLKHSEAILPREMARRMGLHHTNNQHAEEVRFTEEQHAIKRKRRERRRVEVPWYLRQYFDGTILHFWRSDSYRYYRASKAKVSS